MLNYRKKETIGFAKMFLIGDVQDACNKTKFVSEKRRTHTRDKWKIHLDHLPP